MSGETEKEVSGWTTDTLRQDMLRIFAEIDKRFDVMQHAIEVALASSGTLLSERDTRYEQRFQAQEQTTQLALNRVDKEFHEHLAQVREETRAALDAADKAITKSETATEKRFESVNEFRQTLTDQAGLCMPRQEYDRAHTDLVAKVDNINRELTEKVAAVDKAMNTAHSTINSRLDTTQGRSGGLNAGWGYLIAAVSFITTIIVLANLLTNKP